MSNYLGFAPCDKDSYFFVSYNNEDADRVGKIARKLNSRGVPLWYDYGIDYGTVWERKISEKLKNSKAVILFFTKDILLKEHSYVGKEYVMATEYFDKKVYVVMMDCVNNKEIPYYKVPWWIDIKANQNIDIVGIKDSDEIVWKIADAIGMAEIVEDHVIYGYANADTGKTRSEEDSEKTDLIYTGELIDTSTGRTILNNRHELKNVLGEGGFGITYAAEDLRNNNVVEDADKEISDSESAGKRIAEKELKYSDCKDLEKTINRSSNSFVIPEEFTAISEHAFEGLYVENIYIPPTVSSIHKNSLMNVGYNVKAIYLHKDNPGYYIGGNKELIDNRTRKALSVSTGVILKYYSKS